jgi:glutathione synthase/RimK-type ligase-like ATP-grasp enzyme
LNGFDGFCAEIKMRIAFVTSEALVDLYEDDRLAVSELTRLGHRVSASVWTRGLPQDVDAVVMRSPWDWFHRRQEFQAYLEALAHLTVPVLNSAELMLAYADKTYLLKLAALGLPVVPTHVVAFEALGDVVALIEQHQWNQAVLKPAFTANAIGARKFIAADAARVVAEILESSASRKEQFLLQPFVPAIAQGEHSLMFFGGHYSHAVKKIPSTDEWRVQSTYGGSVQAWVALAPEIEVAHAIVAQAAPDSLYARVDLVNWKGQPHLMELEVVEPELFFRTEVAAARRFAEALESKLIRSSGV